MRTWQVPGGCVRQLASVLCRASPPPHPLPVATVSIPYALDQATSSTVCLEPPLVATYTTNVVMNASHILVGGHEKYTPQTIGGRHLDVPYVAPTVLRFDAFVRNAGGMDLYMARQGPRGQARAPCALAHVCCGCCCCFLSFLLLLLALLLLFLLLC